jgi:hypothetical protein
VEDAAVPGISTCIADLSTHFQLKIPAKWVGTKRIMTNTQRNFLVFS